MNNLVGFAENTKAPFLFLVKNIVSNFIFTERGTDPRAIVPFPISSACYNYLKS